MKLLISGLKLSSMHGEKNYHNNNFNVLNEAAYLKKKKKKIRGLGLDLVQILVCFLLEV